MKKAHQIADFYEIILKVASYSQFNFPLKTEILYEIYLLSKKVMLVQTCLTKYKLVREQ